MKSPNLWRSKPRDLWKRASDVIEGRRGASFRAAADVRAAGGGQSSLCDGGPRKVRRLPARFSQNQGLHPRLPVENRLEWGRPSAHLPCQCENHGLGSFSLDYIAHRCRPEARSLNAGRGEDDPGMGRHPEAIQFRPLAKRLPRIRLTTVSIQVVKRGRVD